MSDDDHHITPTLTWQGLWVTSPQSLQMYPCLPGLRLTPRLHTAHWEPLGHITCHVYIITFGIWLHLQLDVLGNKGVVHVDVQLGALLLELPPLGSLEMKKYR